MNKDQRLLEEAYEKIYETIELLPEEELFIEKVSEDIHKNLYKTIGSNSGFSQFNHSNLYSLLFNDPAQDLIGVLNPPEDLRYEFINFYGHGAYGHLRRNVFFRNYAEANGKVDETPYIYFVKIDPSTETGTPYKQTKVPYENKEEVLKTIKDSFREFLQHTIKTSSRNPITTDFVDVLKWRARRLKDIKATKKLSKDFDPDLLKALEGF